MSQNKTLSIREICLFGILAALTFAAKYVMSWMPNIEPVSLMVMLFAVTFGWKALFPIYVYVLMEILFYGLGSWNFNYFYIWAILAFAALALRNMHDRLGDSKRLLRLAVWCAVRAGGCLYRWFFLCAQQVGQRYSL